MNQYVGKMLEAQLEPRLSKIQLREILGFFGERIVKGVELSRTSVAVVHEARVYGRY